MKENINIWDEVYFTPKAYYWNIINNNTLSELRPKKGKVIWIEEFIWVLWWKCFSYKITCDKYNIEVYKKIHTAFLTEDKYYENLASIITNYKYRINIIEAIKNFFTIKMKLWTEK